MKLKIRCNNIKYNIKYLKIVVITIINKKIIFKNIVEQTRIHNL